MRIVGFTSGFNYYDIHPASPEVFRLLRDIGCRAVEINCVGGYEDVPIIIESVCDGIEAAGAELEFVKKHLPREE